MIEDQLSTCCAPLSGNLVLFTMSFHSLIYQSNEKVFQTAKTGTLDWSFHLLDSVSSEIL